jgi:ATP-dependent DNA helicase RecG
VPRTLRRLGAIPVAEIAGVGVQRVEALRDELGIETVLDLLTHYPRRYIDRTKEATLASVVPGEPATLLVDVRSARFVPARKGKPRVEVDVGDGTGRLKLVFFNQPWRTKQLHEGLHGVLVFGKVDVFRGTRQMVNPVVDLVGDRTGRLIPVYPQSEKARIMSWDIGRWVEEALSRAGEFADPLPPALRDRLDLRDRTFAFRHIHAPESFAAKEAARKRLAFDELLRLQLLLVQRKKRVELESMGIRHRTEGELLDRFYAQLPFTLTAAQRRAISEISGDLAGPHPMHRLLQGDVGSGKTLVAVAALLTAVQGGHQGALLAPTEVLAEQHDASVRALLADLAVPTDGGNLFGERPLKVSLLTGRTPAGERAVLSGALKAGEVDILVGTHALLTESVSFHDLGVVVVDEQHRFGVEQRSILREKGALGAVPDVLVMTATPIPRTAAMTVYGDLEFTVLDELPPGRTPITTVWAAASTLGEPDAWQRVRDQVAEGRQAYVVCPLVEESERVQAKSATQEYERLAADELAGLRIGLLHGQLPPKEKEAAMDAFRTGETQVLVATTVIEVGVDVANATVMVILDADRFGIAQLHQLRGRVGRGADRSYCYLLGDAATPEGEERLRALERTTDGFELAEVDLQLRGEGTILGARQKGRNDLKLASLRKDRDLVDLARGVAFELVGDGDGLAALPVLRDELADLVDDDEAEFLFKS